MSVRTRWRLRAVTLAVLAAVGLTACSPAPAGTPVGGGEAAPSATASPGSGSRLGFRATTLDGESFDAATLKGRPVALWFWAPWCSICRLKGPTIASVAKEYAGKVEIIGVAGLGTVEEMAGFVADTDTGELSHLTDTSGAIWQSYGIVTQPAFAFIGPDGSTQTVIGAMSTEDLRRSLDKIAS